MNADWLDRELDGCPYRVFRVSGKERERAVVELGAWFSRYRDMLEFDPDTGRWVIR